MRSVDSNEHSVLINGLRGLAIALVIGFHFQLPLLQNGFWGVDFFFWISGFLITQRFLIEYENSRDSKSKIGQIDIRYYFLRRIRRIVPLSLLIIVVVATSVWIFARDLWQSQIVVNLPSIFTATFNFYLGNSSQDYFLAISQENVFLHYWTLSLEEQVYFLSPFIFVFATSFHGRVILGVKTTWTMRVLFVYSILTIASFAYFVLSLQSNISSTYYSTLTRYWEFGLGSVCAVLHQNGILSRIPRDIRRNLIRFMSLVIFMMLVFSKSSSFDLTVLPPILAISMIVLLADGSAKDTIIGKIVSSSSFQFLGRIAFPLYLVHWPAFVLLKNSSINSNLLLIFVYLLTVILVSYALHLFIEVPTLKFDLERFRRSSQDRSIMIDRQIVRNGRRSAASIMICSALLLGYFQSPALFKKRIDGAVMYLMNNRYDINSSKLDINPNLLPEEAFTPLDVPETDSATSSRPLQPEELTETNSVRTRVPITKSTELIEWMIALRSAAKARFLPKGYSYNQNAVMEAVRKTWGDGCLNSLSASSACTFGSGNKELVLVGDSFAFALVEAISKSLPNDWRMIVLTKGSCLPWDVKQYGKNGILNSECSNHNDLVQRYIQEMKPDLIIASGADQWLEKSTLSDWKTGFSSSAGFYSEHSNRLLVVSSTPGAGNLSTCLEPANSIRACFGNASSIVKYVEYQQNYGKTLGFEYLNLTQYLCVENWCPPVIQGVPVYGDTNHFSKVFSSKLSRIFNDIKIFTD